MAKRSGNTKRVEVWNTRSGSIIKTAVRTPDGKFNGATNYPVKATKVQGTPQA